MGEVTAAHIMQPIMRCFVPCGFAALMQPRSTSRDTSSYEQQQGTVATVALLYSVIL
jgi:hypothetical protein